jgi:hypothetical protein
MAARSHPLPAYATRLCNTAALTQRHSAAEKSSRGPEEEPCNEQAMFVHVPSFEVFDSDTQLNFVHGLLCNITETLVAS